MESTLSNKLSLAAARVAEAIRLAPASGKLWPDLGFLLVAAALHHAILPTFTFGLIPVDLMTPWLVIGFVCHRLLRSAVMLVFGALLIEMHQAAPAGFYVCAYWVIAVTLSVVRSTLSWRHAFLWIVTFALAELWVVLFESFVRGVATGGIGLAPEDLAGEALRIILSTLLGLVLCRPFMRVDIVEEGA